MKEKNNKLLVILLLVFIASTVGLLSYIIYDKTLNNKLEESTEISKENHVQKRESKEEVEEVKEKISLEEYSQIENNLDESEITAIKAFFKELDNSQIPYIEFSNPHDVLNEEGKSYLIYSIFFSSEYSETLESQNIPKHRTTFENIKEFMSDKFNYTFTDEELKDYFSIYLQEDGTYIYLGGGAGMIGEYYNGYKEDNKYHIILNTGNEVVLEYTNNKYYFYSSSHIN